MLRTRCSNMRQFVEDRCRVPMGTSEPDGTVFSGLRLVGIAPAKHANTIRDVTKVVPNFRANDQIDKLADLGD